MRHNVSNVHNTFLISQHFRSGWQMNFLIISCLFGIAAVLSMTVGTGEIEEWAKPSSIGNGDSTNLKAPDKPLKVIVA